MDAPQGARCGLAGRLAACNSCAARKPWRSGRRLKRTGFKKRDTQDQMSTIR